MSKPSATTVDDLAVGKISLTDNSPPQNPVGGGDFIVPANPFEGKLTYWIPVRGYLHTEVYPSIVVINGVKEYKNISLIEINDSPLRLLRWMCGHPFA